LYRSLGPGATAPDGGTAPDDDEIDDGIDDGTDETDDDTPEPAPPLEITTEVIPAGQVGAEYAATLEGRGGVPPYVWAASGLPAGLSLDPASGEISGQVADAGSFSVEVTVTDSQADPYTDTSSLIFEIAAGPGCENNSTIPHLECAALVAFAASTS